MSTPEKDAARLLLERYTNWLLEYGYCDDDVWSEEPTAVDRFFAAKI